MRKINKVNTEKLEAVKEYTQRYYSLYDLFGDIGIDRESKKLYCPFHNENIPSFNVDYENNNYHCFSCGSGGGYLNFLHEYEEKVLRIKKGYYQFVESVLKKDNQMRHILGFDSIFIEYTQSDTIKEIMTNPLTTYTPKQVDIKSYITEEKKIKNIKLLLDYYSAIEKGDSLDVAVVSRETTENSVSNLFSSLLAEDEEDDD